MGEVAASHGVYRPGGTALNAGQVGSMRAAQYIAKTGKGMPEEETLFSDIAQKALVQMNRFAENVKSAESNVRKLHMHAAKNMSMCGAAIRNKEEIEAYCKKLPEVIESLSDRVKISAVKELKWAFRLRDELIAQFVYLSAMLDYISNGGKSRGSALYTDLNGIKPFAQLPDVFTFKVDDGGKGDLIQEVRYKGACCQFEWRKVRPIPKEDDFFENVWRSYRENENVY